MIFSRTGTLFLIAFSILLGCLTTADQAPLSQQIARQTILVRRLRKEIDSTRDLQSKAQKWLALNRAADSLAQLWSGKRTRRTSPGPPGKTPAADVRIAFCEPGNDWYAVPTGYKKYLELWPDGPDADEAYWKSEIENGCGDFEGSEQEYRDGIKLYSAFLEKYAGSRFAAQARSQLKDLQEGLDKLLAQKTVK